ncbi:MAG TPA: RNase J family beta-CASP ribonuclease [Candidatus Methanoculleus thermohydrogenotrophicum]|jgi:ribonuclease J|nr:RNase J family beta-CASP ribonuclease [Candidatus Methanoculleus thermohydrogenotrophicum]NLM81278.1 RNase J family beta-CASP ribonuclease [Candidatus Methanoculleus thermohydrogenotrophicum]HOB17386.1 RNase J family beta-CASP ribonuclease [Candidatus Methanoculleus thermohydrogenotrophicum]HPZ37541.1 RNase J family beta-CASP ribonuclease [Candidatus Methanoculleus thermohydrogenotrophicum]HQC90993.1 RNase J family beta-CASP ribonuclease [Candidatus Methanoculleus thermohydrogenotrophicum]
MDIEIIAVGGYDEVGRNMTAVRCGKEIVIFDMGLRLDQVMIHEDADIESMHSLDLIEMKAIPDDTIMNAVEGSVKAIVCSHGHLDHIGAIPKLAHRYNAPIISTPYTTELIRQQIAGEQKFGVNNKLFALRTGQRYTISPHLTLEFVRSQHSIIDTVFPVLHTPRGAVIYANDFKLDRTPVLGEPPDFARLRQIAKEGVLALIVESTNIENKGRCPSEKIARDLVRDTITSYEDDKSGIFVSTFSSHISRIKTIAECAHEIGRKPVLLGRSMERYSSAAEQLKLVAFPDTLSMFGNRRTVDRTLRRIMKTGKDRFLPIVTGHQGEPGAILTRVVMGDTPYRLEKGDKILFSAKVIPNPMNRGQRYLLEARARMAGVRIFDELHVSGHAYREDHYEFLHLISPQHVIPAHGDIDMTGGYARFAEDLGYTLGNDLHILRNGQKVLVK